MRNIPAFSKAPLAKQTWRIIKYPSSLMEKALKNKYFPYSSFMDVKLSPIASYTWKSIMSARSFLSKGVKKIVGRGNTINIWEDPWVSTLPNFRILTAENKEEERPRHVCELIVDGA